MLKLIKFLIYTPIFFIFMIGFVNTFYSAFNTDKDVANPFFFWSTLLLTLPIAFFIKLLIKKLYRTRVN